jgi:hypothetical protein
MLTRPPEPVAFADLPRPMQNDHTRTALIENGQLVWAKIHDAPYRRDRGGIS